MARKLRPLPIGVTNYIKTITEFHYVDKTLLIKDLLDEKGEVNLIMRPRRFGKSLNLDMLKTFFEKTEEDTSVYFRDKKIWKAGKKYRKEQGKYPVITISLKCADSYTWKDTYDSVTELISEEFRRHSELITSDKVQEDDLNDFNQIRNGRADLKTYKNSLKLLTRMLYSHYGVAPIVLIDEYDVPLQQGYTNGYYNESISFLKDFFSNGLKDNDYLNFAVMTGVLKISKESFYTGFNNPKSFSILSDRLSEYFGFTLDDVKDLLKYYMCEDKLDEVIEWYDGYNFGGTQIFNPLSVISYIDAHCNSASYWVNTSSNSLIGDVLNGASEDTANKLNKLLQGETIECEVNENLTYSDINDNSENVFSLLLFSGYLKIKKNLGKKSKLAHNCYELKIANNEIQIEFASEIMAKLQHESKSNLLQEIWRAIEASSSGDLASKLQSFLMSCSSCFDTEKESFYHGLCLGLCAYKSESHFIRSNKESGEGRYDIALEPKDKSGAKPVILELKRLDQADAANLKDKAKEALRQIDDTKYDTDLKDRGFTNIIKIGIAFCGKNVAVAI